MASAKVGTSGLAATLSTAAQGRGGARRTSSFQFEVYVVESGRFGVCDEVALIEVEHRVAITRLDRFENCTHSGQQVSDRSGVEAAENIGIAVDRFEQRQSATGA